MSDRPLVSHPFSYLTTMNEKVLGHQLDELRTTLKQINETNVLYYNKIRELTKIIEKSGQAFTKMCVQYTANAENFSSYVKQIEQYQSEITSANENLTENMAVLTVKYDIQNENTALLAEHTGKLSVRMTELTELCSKMNTLLLRSDENRQKFAENAEILIQQTKQSSDVVNHYAMMVAEESSSITEKLSKYTDSHIDRSVETLADLSDKFEKTSENLGKAYEELSEQLNAGLRDSFELFDSNTAAIVLQLNEVLENITASADYIPERLNQAIDNAFDKREKERNRMLEVIRDDNITEIFPETEIDETDADVSAENDMSE